MRAPLLEVRELSVSYGKVEAVHNVSLSMQEGSIVTVIGPNGAGKTTLLGAVMGEVRPPDLNILDAVWINANPYDGPWTSYDGATRRDELVAGVDPVAIDIWAVTNILVPAFLDNGVGGLAAGTTGQDVIAHKGALEGVFTNFLVDVRHPTGN